MRLKITPIALILGICSLFSSNIHAQTGLSKIEGMVMGHDNAPIEAISVSLSPSGKNTITDSKGHFTFERLKAGTYTISIYGIGYQKTQETVTVEAGATLSKEFHLMESSEQLPGLEVVGSRTFRDASFLPSVQGTNIYAGKKTQLINLTTMDADLAENLPRQVFAKVPGAMIWEMDGTGNQVGVATRGLIPHRSWELHTEQNGNTTNSDLFGYPEAHYNPPMEAVGAIKLVRGSSALQYGPQFGGMLEYEIKKPDTTRAISLETQQGAGSFGLFSSFNAIGGKVGKLTYYAYYDFRRADGWRQNSDYNFTAWHGSVKYDFTPKMNLVAELSHMEYVNHFAAGLTDSMFQANPRASNRPRNYFGPTIYLPALHFNWQIGQNTFLEAKSAAILGQRNSVQFITLPTVNDVVNPVTNDYAPRQVDRDHYHSYEGEVRLRQQYELLKNKSNLAVGVRYGNSRTVRNQKGEGTTGWDYDLSLTQPYRIELEFNTLNYAFFAENQFQLTKKLSFTPGMRYEMIDTKMSGVFHDLPDFTLPLKLKRNFPLFGAGLEYDITESVNAYANFTQNFRPVLHSDLIPATDLDRVNPDLKDSKGNSSEIGLRGNLGNVLQFDVNYFRLQYDNRIGTLILNEDANTYFYHTNIGDMTNQGGEFFLEFHPFNLMGSPSEYLGFSLFTSTSYNSAKYTRGEVKVGNANQSIVGNDVENIPQWISRNGITYEYRRLSATMQWSYVGQNYSDALNTEYTATGVNGIVPSYLLTDFNLAWNFYKTYNVRFSVNNIADKRYFTRRATGYPGPGILPSDGRSFLVSFGAKF